MPPRTFFVFLRRVPSYYSNGLLISLRGGLCVTDGVHCVMIAPLNPFVPDKPGLRRFRKSREAMPCMDLDLHSFMNSKYLRGHLCFSYFFGVLLPIIVMVC